MCENDSVGVLYRNISKGEVTFFFPSFSFLSWHMLTVLRTLSLVLADTWWHFSSFRLQISGSDSRSDGLSGTSSYSEGPGFCSRLRPTVPRGVLRFYCVPSMELRSQPFRFIIYLRYLSCGIWWKYTDVARNLLPSALRQNTGCSMSRRLL